MSLRYGITAIIASLKYMNSNLLIFLLIAPLWIYAQRDSLKVTREDICTDLYREEPTDSTYQSFYITEQEDTFYFENTTCVIMKLPVDPYGLVIYNTKSGRAQGWMEWAYFVDNRMIHICGTFEQGVFVEGVRTSYYKSGSVESIAEFMNARPSGNWTHYLEDGSVEFECTYVDGVCINLNDGLNSKKVNRKSNRSLRRSS